MEAPGFREIGLSAQRLAVVSGTFSRFAKNLLEIGGQNAAILPFPHEIGSDFGRHKRTVQVSTERLSRSIGCTSIQGLETALR